MLYGYRCPSCATGFERIESVAHAMDEQPCPDCGMASARELTAPMVSPDIAPYQAVAGDKAGGYITSRREHREFLKRNNLVEVGSQPIKDTKQMRRVVPKGEIRQELARVVPEVRKAARRK